MRRYLIQFKQEWYKYTESDLPLDMILRYARIVINYDNADVYKCPGTASITDLHLIKFRLFAQGKTYDTLREAIESPEIKGRLPW